MDVLMYGKGLKRKKIIFFLIISAYILFTAVLFCLNISNFSATDIAFFLMSVSYFLISISFALFLFFYVDREKFNMFKAYIFYLIIFLFTLFWLPFGVDLTDAGEQLSTAWFLFDDPNFLYTKSFTKLGSWMVNSLWLNLLDSPSVLWERIAGLFVMTGIGFTSFMIVRKYRDDNYTFFGTLIVYTLVLCRNSPELKIDYNNIPMLTVLIGLYLFSCFEFNKQGRKKYIFLISGSLLIYISTLLRFPFILFVPMPLLYFILKRLYKDISTKIMLKNIFFSYIIPLIGLVSIFIFFYFYKKEMVSRYTDFITGFIRSVSSISVVSFEIMGDDSLLRKHSYYLFLLKRYIFDFIKIFVFALLFLSGFFIAKPVFNNILNKKRKLRKLLIPLFILVLTVLMLIKGWFWYMGILGFCIAVLVYIKHNGISMKDEFFLLFWGIVLVLVSFQGSNTSIRLAFPSGAILIIIPYIIQLVKDKQKALAKHNITFVFRLVTAFFIIMLLIGLGKKVFSNGKRDYPLWKMTHTYDSPVLFGVLGSKARTEAIDELIEVCEKEIHKENTVITMNHIPAINFYINRNFYLSHAWTEFLRMPKLSINLDMDEKMKKRPDFIIYAKSSGRNPTFPESKQIISTEDYDIINIKESAYLHNYLKQKAYISIFENKGFILYKSPILDNME